MSDLGALRTLPGGGRILFPRRHYFEINDEPWWPQFLREFIQDLLMFGWTTKLPLIQNISPAALVSKTISSILSSRVGDYVYIDFASGAGGPTPVIEHTLNEELERDGKQPVQFVLSDISPHLGAWSAAAKKSDNLTYIPTSVDATDAPKQDILLRNVPEGKGKKVMRLFSLAFHHFDDELAGKVLKNTFDTSDGFCIFELQSRRLVSFIVISLLGPLSLLITPILQPFSLTRLFFTYIIPALPFVFIYDGYISSLRTRTPEEVRTLIEKNVDKEKIHGWTFKTGHECYMWPIGWLYWIIAYKD